MALIHILPLGAAWGIWAICVGDLAHIWYNTSFQQFKCGRMLLQHKRYKKWKPAYIHCLTNAGRLSRGKCGFSHGLRQFSLITLGRPTLQQSTQLFCCCAYQTLGVFGEAEATQMLFAKSWIVLQLFYCITPCIVWLTAVSLTSQEEPQSVSLSERLFTLFFSGVVDLITFF